MRGLWVLKNAVFCLVFNGVLAMGSLAEQGNPEAGKVTYETICAACHGMTGKGNGPAASMMPRRPRNHTEGGYMNTLTDDYLFRIIKEGGAAVGKRFMPGWGAQLKDPEIWNVVAYIRSLAVPPYQAATASTPATEGGDAGGE